MSKQIRIKEEIYAQYLKLAKGNAQLVPTLINADLQRRLTDRPDSSVEEILGSHSIEFSELDIGL